MHQALPEHLACCPHSPPIRARSQGHTSTANLWASGPHECQPHLRLPSFSQHSRHLALGHRGPAQAWPWGRGVELFPDFWMMRLASRSHALGLSRCLGEDSSKPSRTDGRQLRVATRGGGQTAKLVPHGEARASVRHLGRMSWISPPRSPAGGEAGEQGA